MKILHTEASSGWGGQEMRILKEAILMREEGHEIYFAIEEKGTLIQKAEAEGFPVYSCRFQKRYWLKTAWHLSKILKENQIDLVNTHSSLDAWIAGIVAKYKNIPILRTRHISAPIREGLNSRILYGFLADMVITTCQKIVPEIVRKSRISYKNCLSIPTGLACRDLAPFFSSRDAERKKWSFRPKDFVIGTACFMRSWKGIEDLLHAAKLVSSVPHIQFLLIGKDEQNRYIRLRDALGLQKTVHFVGHVDNPFPLINALDAFVLTSTKNEGVSQATLQAAFFEKPLITTPVGGLPEVCIDGKTGIQVPVGSPEKLAEAMQKLANNTSWAEGLGKQAKSLVQDQFTDEKMVAKLKKVYAKLVLS